MQKEKNNAKSDDKHTPRHGLEGSSSIEVRREQEILVKSDKSVVEGIFDDGGEFESKQFRPKPRTHGEVLGLLLKQSQSRVEKLKQEIEQVEKLKQELEQTESDIQIISQLLLDWNETVAALADNGDQRQIE